MKKTAILGAVFAVTLLAGCAGPAAPDAAPVTVPPAAGASVAAGDDPAAATATASATAFATKSAPSPTEEGPKKSERGNLIKEPGQVAGIMNEDGSELVLFTVHSIKADFTCTGPYKEKPENGHFLALDVSVETKKGVKDEYYSDWSMNPYGFKTIAPNGTTSNADLGTMASYSCVDDSEQLPEVGDNEKARGLVVLDVETDEGTLVFSDSNVGAAWEWEYPAT